MNDRYLFKAKDYVTGEWHIGLLDYILDEYCYIRTKQGVKTCWLNTLCQCTGWKDKELIFENDVVVADRYMGIVKFGYYEWDEAENIGFYIGWNKVDYRQDLGYWLDKIKVVGSIIDNPELLEAAYDD